MDRKYLIPAGIAVLAVLFISLMGAGCVNYNGAAPVSPAPASVQPNLTFTVQAADEGNYTVFRYTPSANITGPVSTAYEVMQGTNRIISDQKIFDSVSQDNPIEISLKKQNGTYAVLMLIAGPDTNIVHKSMTTWDGSQMSSNTNISISQR